MNDANLINEVINNNDNHLIMIRLLNYRDESQRKEIDWNFRRNANISMHQRLEIIFLIFHNYLIYLNYLIFK